MDEDKIVKYAELETGDIFLINDIKTAPKLKNDNGFFELTTGEQVREKDLPMYEINNFQFKVISKQELAYLKDKYGLTIHD